MKRLRTWLTRFSKNLQTLNEVDSPVNDQRLSEVKSLARPALGLCKASQFSLSKFGGRPNLPPTHGWPQKDGVFLSFLAQFDLEAIPRPDGFIDLPETGALYFFYDFAEDSIAFGVEQSDIGSWRVLYSPESLSKSALRGLPTNADEGILLSECKVTFHTVPTYPELESLFPWDSQGQALRNAYNELWRGVEPRVEDWIGGYFAPVQESVEQDLVRVSVGEKRYKKLSEERRNSLASIWVPLLQIGICSNLTGDWGPSWAMFFSIKRADLLAQRFDKVWLMSQID